jgi:hypothetical protein
LTKVKVSKICPFCSRLSFNESKTVQCTSHAVSVQIFAELNNSNTWMEEMKKTTVTTKAD